MLINNKKIETFNCKPLKFLVNHSNYANESIFMNNSLIYSEGYNKEELRSLETEFLFRGTKSDVEKNISRFIEEVKRSIIKKGDLNYKVNIASSEYIDILTQYSNKQSIKFDVLDVYEDEKSITKNTNFNITINSPKECYANLELSASTNVISYTVTINDTEIVVKNIKGGETVYIGSGKVLAGGKSKIDDVELWEFPVLKPGTNNITVNRADVNLKIKYNERW